MSLHAPSLAWNGVEVWLVHADAFTATELRERLTEAEMGSMERLRRLDDRLRYGSCRWALRCLAAAYTGLPRSEIRFTRVCRHCGRPGHGKLQLALGADNHSLCLSVAHSGGLGTIAITQGNDIGVDVELVRDCDERTVKGALHPREYAAWRHLSSRRRASEFTALWVRKEAVAKGIGLGLALPPAEVHVIRPAAPSGYETVLTERYGLWYTRAIDVGDDYASAVAVCRPDTGVRVHRWSEMLAVISED